MPTPRTDKKPVPKAGLRFERHWTRDGVHPFDEVPWERRTASISNERGETIFEQCDVEVPSFWGQLAVNIVVSKYFRGHTGTPERETSVRQMISRVVDTITGFAASDGLFATPADEAAFHDELAWLVLHQRMAFNSPVWFNVGHKDPPQTSACHISPVEDSMEGIMDLARMEALLFKGGSGSGSNLSCLRAAGERLSGGGEASGPLSWMRGYDAFAGAIKSGGSTRRAAKIVILDADHPDVVAFAGIKAHEEDKALALIREGYDSSYTGEAYASVGYQNANLSVRVTDAFMKAVEADGDWHLTGRVDHRLDRVIKARDLLAEMARGAWRCGDPGIQFDTAINSWHTAPASGRINASNPCCFVGETKVLTDAGSISMTDLEDASSRGEKMPKAVVWDSAKGKAAHRRILRVWKAGDASSIVRVTFSDGQSFCCTPEHRFLVDNRKGGRWVKAASLVVGTRVRSSGGDTRNVSSISLVIQRSPIPVFDAEIDYAHNFAVVDRDNCDGVIVHNSEFMFVDGSSCNLASLNLLAFRESDGSFDIAGFRHAVGLTITAQEALVGHSSYPAPVFEERSHALRPLGIGYANLGAMLMADGLAYDSDAGRAYAAVVTAVLGGEAYAQSARIAEAVGPFAEFAANREPMLSVIGRHRDAALALDPSAAPIGLRQAAIDAWTDALSLGQDHGYRNAQTSLLPPTGTISFLMGCDTTGVEPAVALVSYKKLVGEGYLKMVSGNVVAALRALGYNEEQAAIIGRHIDERDTIEGAPGLRPEHLPVFDCAIRPQNGVRSISADGHIKMMTAIQPFLSGAISKTVNMPEDSTPGDIERVYVESWKLGLKAIAVYRDNCKHSQPLSTRRATGEDGEDGETALGAAETGREIEELQAALRAANELVEQYKERDSAPSIPVPVRRRMPADRASRTHKFSIAGTDGYVTAGLYPDGHVGEIFLSIAKEGSIASGFANSWATAVSVALQYGAPLTAVVSKFHGVRFDPMGFTGNDIHPLAMSIVDYVANWLAVNFLTVEERARLGLPTKAQPVLGLLGQTPAAPALRTEAAQPAPISVGPDAAQTPAHEAHTMAPEVVAALSVGAEGRVCTRCGSRRLIRTGICFTCSDCGEPTSCG